MRVAALAAVSAAALCALADAPAVRAATPRPTFQELPSARLAVTTPAYRLVLSRRDGRVLELLDRREGVRLLGRSPECWWFAAAVTRAASIGGCGVTRTAPRGFAYRWTARTSTLALTYAVGAPRPARATLTLVFEADAIEARLRLEQRRGSPIREVAFPTDLLARVDVADAGYLPAYMPGIRVGAAYFAQERSSLRPYPSRWATADFLALDLAGSHLAVSAGDPASPRPVALGFVRESLPSACSGAVFCIRHVFQTWVPDGGTWTSPPVRLDVGVPVETALERHRRATGIDTYPSAREKLGAAWDRLVRAPLVKLDARAGLGAFTTWGRGLDALPVPSLLHPVAFQPSAHDESSPDFLPPDPALGTTQEFAAMLARGRAAGHAVMPYLNMTWWDDGAPSTQALRPAAVAVRDAGGAAVAEYYNGRRGYVVSPWAPGVVRRWDETFAEWGRDAPADCLFFDQIGARPWLRDFTPAAPDPTAYTDGWLRLLARHPGRCVMVEDGWDRLARSAAGFHGSALMLAREHDEPDEVFGEGNWEPWPLGPLLFGDKVLMYQHDLAPETLVDDLEVLAWNVAFGIVMSVEWNEWQGTLAGPWPTLAGALQRALGPHVAGRRPDSFRRVGERVTETRWGAYSVTANFGRERVVVDGYGLPQHGFLARTDDGSLVAGAFEGLYGGAPLAPGIHVLLAERTAEGTSLKRLLVE